MDIPVYEPVSLGYACETKFQIARVLNSRLNLKKSEMSFRLAITQDDHAERLFGWRLFDWQSTPLDIVCLFMEQDFEGFFEREDLAATDDGIYNVKFQTRYLHEFRPLPGRKAITDEDIDRGFPIARRRFDRLCGEFRQLLTQPGPYLYVVAHAQFPDAPLVERLVKALCARSAEHRFHLLVMADEGQDSDLTAFDGRLTKAWRPAVCDKPAFLRWEGDDGAWDRALGPYALALRDVAGP